MTAPGCAWRLGGISLPRIKPSLWGKELSGPPSNLTPILLSVSPAGGSSHSRRPPHNQRPLSLPPPSAPSPSHLFVLIPHPSIYRSLLTGAFRHFLHTCSQLAAFISGEENLLHRSFGEFPFMPFHFVLSGFVSPSFSLLLFFYPFFFLRPPSIPTPPSPSAIPIYL